MANKKQAYIRQANEIENLEVGKEVVLIFNNGEEYTGIFNGVDGDLIKLKAIASKHMIGLPLASLSCYMERFK
jgi:hypothetical protein